MAALAEEILKRFVLTQQLLHQVTCCRIGKPQEFATLPVGNLATERDVVMSRLIRFPRLASQIQTAIPGKVRIAKFNGLLLTLDRHQIEAEFVGALNQHIESITQTGDSDRRVLRTHAEKPARISDQEPLGG